MPRYYGTRRTLLDAPYRGPLIFDISTSSPPQPAGAPTSFLTFTNGGATATDNGPNGWTHTVKTYYPKSSGKWYIEFLINNVSISTYIGLGSNSLYTGSTTRVGLATPSIAYYSDGTSGVIYWNGGTEGVVPAAYTSGDRIGIAYDFTGFPFCAVRFYRNGVSQYFNSLFTFSDLLVPMWSNDRSSSSATVISSNPLYLPSGYTYLGPG